VVNRILITGGAGFIGSALSNSLSKSNLVTAVDNLKTGDWARCDSAVTKIDLDLAELSYSEICELVTGYDDVYHLAAVKLHNQNNSLEDILMNNCSVSAKLFDAAGSVGVKNIFFSSSLYAYGSMGPEPMVEDDALEPTTYYGASKRFGELALLIAARKYGFRALTARFFFIYGPNQYSEGGYKSVIVKNFENAIRLEPFQIVGDGKQALDYVYIDDCIEIIQKLMATDYSGVVNISSGMASTILTIVGEMKQITNNFNSINLDKDFTHGSVRYGSTSRLNEIIGGYTFLDLSQGLERTWKSILASEGGQ